MNATNKTNNLRCLLLLLLLKKKKHGKNKLEEIYCVCKEDSKYCARNYFSFSVLLWKFVVFFNFCFVC